jgi:DNA-binding NarL/FixJ family response regulator
VVSDSAAVRVVVGDDEPLTRQGIVSVLQEASFDVVGTAGDAEDLVRKALAHKPDVVIADIRMPPGNADDGLRAAQRIREARPETGVLILSQYLEAQYALSIVGDHAAGSGYLLKQRVGDLSLFIDAVRRISRGGSVMDPAVVERMVARPRTDSALSELTKREREVLGAMAEGRSNAAIAGRLVVTVSAVENHITAIFDKLGLRPEREDHRRVLAVLRYLRS